jgi:aldose sugar dehydrogenase
MLRGRLFRVALLAFALLSPAVAASAQSESADQRMRDREAIAQTIQWYFDGWAVGDTVLMGRAMHSSVHLKRVVDGKFADMTRQQYLGGGPLRPRHPTLATRIVSIDVVGHIASARTEISINDATFVDYFNLLRLEEGWRIVDKVAIPVARGSAPDVSPRPIKETVLDGLDRPWAMAFLSADQVLISEKEGALLRVDLQSRQRVRIAGFPKDLADSLGVNGAGDNTGRFDVVDPAFATTRAVFLSYAAKGPGGKALKVVRAELRGDSLQALRTVLVATPYTDGRHHYGGGLAIGRDGKLYVTVGERLFTERDEPAWPIAQDRRDRRGKIYRFNTDGSVPRDNPDFGRDAVPGLYATGIRASQGLALDPRNGEIWFTEHGTHQGDELNLLRPGANYGWPLRTSGSYRDTAYVPPAARDSLTAPAWTWPHTVAPTALHFYTGHEFPSWRHSLLVAGLSRGSLWRMRIEDGVVVSAEELFTDARERLREIAESPNGDLYLLTDDKNGKLIRVRNAR